MTPNPNIKDPNVVQAASIKVGISNYVGTAALAVLAGSVALFSFVKQNYDPSLAFYLTVIGAVLALVASIVLGGSGANTTAYLLAAGTWKNDPLPEFDWQARLTLAGLILVLAAAAFGTGSPPHRIQDPCFRVVSADLQKSSPDIEQLRRDLITCQR